MTVRNITRGLKAIFVFLGLLGSAGCITATTYERERVDQELVGNRGCIQGRAAEKVTEKKKSRELVEFTVELPPYPSWKKYEWSDKDLARGNRGYIYRMSLPK